MNSSSANKRSWVMVREGTGEVIASSSSALSPSCPPPSTPSSSSARLPIVRAQAPSSGAAATRIDGYGTTFLPAVSVYGPLSSLESRFDVAPIDMPRTSLTPHFRTLSTSRMPTVSSTPAATPKRSQPRVRSLQMEKNLTKQVEGLKTKLGEKEASVLEGKKEVATLTGTVEMLNGQIRRMEEERLREANERESMQNELERFRKENVSSDYRIRRARDKRDERKKKKAEPVIRQVAKRGIQKKGRRVRYHLAADWRTRKARRDSLNEFLSLLVVTDGESDESILNQKVELVKEWAKAKGCALIEKKHQRKLDPETDLSLMLTLNITVKQRRKMKKALKELGFDIFASNSSVESLRREWGRRFDYTMEYGINEDGEEDKNMIIATMNDVAGALTDRVQMLINSGQLTQESLTDGLRVCVLIDKGGETTKMAMQIANISNPNSASNLMLTGLYTSEDNRENLMRYFKHLADEIDAIKEVTVSINEQPATVPITLFFCSDLKGIYAALGLKGQSSSHNCGFCERPSRKPGVSRGRAGDFWKLKDNEPLATARTLERLALHSTKGAFSVQLNSSPLFPSIPIDRVVRSPLHIIQGVAQDLCLKKLHAEALRYDLQSLNPTVPPCDEEYEFAPYSSDDDSDEEQTMEDETIPTTEPDDDMEVGECDTMDATSDMGVAMRTEREESESREEALHDPIESEKELQKSIGKAKEDIYEIESQMRDLSSSLLELDAAATCAKAISAKQIVHPRGFDDESICALADLCCFRHKDSNAIESGGSEIKCYQCKKLYHHICTALYTSDHVLQAQSVQFICIQCTRNSPWTVRDTLTSMAKGATNIRAILSGLDKRLDKVKQRKASMEAVRQKRGNKMKEIERAYVCAGADLSSWFQQINGNHTYRILHGKGPSILWNCFKGDKAKEEKRLMKTLGKLQSLATSKLLSAEEITRFHVLVTRFHRLASKLNPEQNITPKIHALLIHVHEYLVQWQSWGEMSEQGLETLHAIENSLRRKYITIRDRKLRYNHILIDFACRTAVHDRMDESSKLVRKARGQNRK